MSQVSREGSTLAQDDSEDRTIGDPIVIIDNVQKSFGGNHVLKAVSLSVCKGEVVVICGRSGSGKSTLLRCIDQLEGIDSGTIRAAGHLMGFREANGKLIALRDAQIARQQRDPGMVFQNFNLFPHVSVIENITMAPVRILKRDVSEVREEAPPETFFTNPSSKHTTLFLSKILKH